MNEIYAIVTHRNRLDEAAEAWKECNVCAIGFRKLGDLRNKEIKELSEAARLFLKIKKGDIILAYAGRNRIAYVGEAKNGIYIHTNKNIVGQDENRGGFGYQNQYEVTWWDEPNYFSRKDLPKFLCDQFGRRGRTVTQIEFGHRSFENIKQIILTNAISGSQSYDVNEGVIKAGIRKYLRSHLNSLENGLKITGAEKPTSEANRPDFIAKDEKGQTVLIECKGHAYPRDYDQLTRYEETYVREKPRLMLIAFKLDDELIRLTKMNLRVELYECNLTFKRMV